MTQSTKNLKKHALTGLTPEEVLLSRKRHGSNLFTKRKRKSFLLKYLESFGDPIIRILFIAVFLEVLLTLGHCNWIEVIGIVLAALVAAGVSTVRLYPPQKALMSVSPTSVIC